MCCLQDRKVPSAHPEPGRCVGSGLGFGEGESAAPRCEWGCEGAARGVPKGFTPGPFLRWSQVGAGAGGCLGLGLGFGRAQSPAVRLSPCPRRNFLQV